MKQCSLEQWVYEAQVLPASTDSQPLLPPFLMMDTCLILRLTFSSLPALCLPGSRSLKCTSKIYFMPYTITS